MQRKYQGSNGDDGSLSQFFIIFTVFAILWVIRELKDGKKEPIIFQKSPYDIEPDKEIAYGISILAAIIAITSSFLVGILYPVLRNFPTLRIIIFVFIIVSGFTVVILSPFVPIKHDVKGNITERYKKKVEEKINREEIYSKDAIVLKKLLLDLDKKGRSRFYESDFI